MLNVDIMATFHRSLPFPFTENELTVPPAASLFDLGCIIM